MMSPRAKSTRAGWTLLELVLAGGLLVVVCMKAAALLRSANQAVVQQPSAMVLEDQAHALLDRISLAILGSDRESLFPQFENPVHMSSVRYDISVGVQDGEVIWGDPEEIGLQGDQQVVWRSNPDEPDETRVVWSNIARPFLEGEVQNGVDDNGNGLIDERGLSFILEGNSVTVRLTLGRLLDDETDLVRTVETMITVRNHE